MRVYNKGNDYKEYPKNINYNAREPTKFCFFGETNKSNCVLSYSLWLDGVNTNKHLAIWWNVQEPNDTEANWLAVGFREK